MKAQPVSEFRIVASLALLYAFRMLGLFMVLPVLMLYGAEYNGSSAFLLGVALGIYGLTQACLQIPLGLLSDILGRKPIIVLGLVLFAIGSVWAAQAESVYGLIIGRALQGAGAIASTIMALVSDLTSEQNRTKAMAAIGASIGMSFSVALVVGPLLAGLGGMAAIFWMSAALAGVGLLVVWLLVPRPRAAEIAGGRDTRAVPRLVMDTLRNAELARLDWGIFCLHFVLMSSFVAIPGVLEGFNFEPGGHWKIYLPVMVVAFIAMLPFIIIAERKRQVKPVFLGAIIILVASQFGLAQWHNQVVLSLAMLFVFFMGFNLLEATLPSLISKLAPAGTKGTAMGVYSTSQFLGAFCGGVAGGLTLQQWGAAGVFVSCGVVGSVWWLVARFMRKPRHLSSIRLPLGPQLQPADVGAAALALAGVEEVVWVQEEGLLYVKVDTRELDYDQLLLLTGNPVAVPAGASSLENR